MTTPADGDALEGLLVDLFDQGLSAERWLELRSLLADPVQRRRYRRYVRLHAMLEAELVLPHQLPLLPSDIATPSAAQGKPVRAPLSRAADRRLSFRPWRWAAAALVLIAIGALTWNARRLPESAPTWITVTAAEGAASAQWQPGTRVGSGAMTMQAGVVHFIFDSGVEVTLRGAAHATVVSTQELALTDGALVAWVPARAIGFTVTTAQARVVDLGTEFGVAVGDSGEAQVAVRQGHISLATTVDQSTHSDLVGAGEARRIDGGGRVTVTPMDAAIFSFAPAVAAPAERAQAAIRRLHQDPSLIAWYEGSVVDGQDHRLVNTAPGHLVGDGEVSGTHATPGHVPGSVALAFDDAHDRARISIPGRYQALTLGAWVRFRERGPETTALFATDGWGVAPLLHWTCLPDGRMSLNLCSPTFRIWTWQAERPLPPPSSAWHLLACTVSADGTARFTCDGDVLGESRHPQSLDFGIGQAEIGNWAAHAHDQPQRPSMRQLHGDLDGLFILQRALAPAELAALSYASPAPMP